MMNPRSFVFAAAAGFALCIPCAVGAQEEAPAPRTDSGVVVATPQRIPLEQYYSPRGCPEDLGPDEICVEGRPPEEEPFEEPPPEPGDRETDVQAEREALSELGSTTTPSDCSAVGAAGQFGCTGQVFRDWKRERELKKAREKVPEPN